MSQFFSVHPTHPQQRLVARAAEIIRQGGLAVFPTDTTYALGCRLGDKSALDRVRRIRRLDKGHLFTLVCRDLSEISTYARVSDANYRIIKHLTPGPFTVVLPATREVPRRLVHPKRKTIGLRIPDNVILQTLLEALEEPIMSTTMRLPEHELPLAESEDIRYRLEHEVDVIVNGGACGLTPTTVVDLTSDSHQVLRQGLGEFP